MLGFLPTRAYRPGTPGATTFLSPLSGTFNYGWDSFQGSIAADNVVRMIGGEAPGDFVYKDLGMLAVIGRNAAAAHLWGRSFTGFAAWSLWLVVHVAKLIGFRNRVLVLVNWAWNYVFYRRAVRLILPDARVEAGEDKPPMA